VDPHPPASAEDLLLLRVRFRAWTPLWPGGFDGASLYLLGGGGYRVSYPAPGQLVGRARWLLRAAACGAGSPTHRASEWRAERAFGSTERASPVQVILRFSGGAPFIEPGSPKHEALERAYEGLAREGLTDYFARVLEVEGFSRLRSACGLGGGTPLGGSARIHRAYQRVADTLEELPDEVAMLWAIPRILLAFQDKGPGEVVRLQPIGHERLEACLEVYRRRHATLEAEALRDALASLMAVPTLLGLGKATSRGFGRLYPERMVDMGRLPGDVEEAVRTLAEAGREAHISPEGFKRFLSALAEALGVKADEEPSHTHCPLLSLTLQESQDIPRIRHPCPYATAELPYVARDRNGCGREKRPDCSRLQGTLRVLCILSALGKATLKSTWKAYTFGMSLKDPGFTLHTWPLGLPRGGGRARSRTGYHELLPPEGGGERYARMYRSLVEEGEVIGGWRPPSREPRLQSPVHLIPAGPGAFLAVYPYTASLERLLGEGMLAHYGLHRRSHRGGGPTWHVTLVVRGAEREKLKMRGARGGLTPPPSRAAGGGVVAVRGGARRVAWEALRFSVEWLLYLLG
jgi:hypothetical protein